MDDQLRTEHTRLPGYFVSRVVFDVFIPRPGCCVFWFGLFGLFVFCVLLLLWFCWCFCLFLVFGVCSLFLCGMTSYNLTPQVFEAVTASASLAVINAASKHLHNDLARAIEALGQKKSQETGALFAFISPF